MATAADVIHALTNVHETIAKRFDDAPTGVVPMYHPALGAAVKSNGTIRHVGLPQMATVWGDDITGNSIANNASTKILLLDINTTYAAYTVDTAAFWASGHAFYLVFPSTGYYDIVGLISWAANATGSRLAGLEYLDGAGAHVTDITSVRAVAFSSSGGPRQQVSIQNWPATAGYGVALIGRQNSGGNLSVTDESFLSVRRIG